ncbi:GLPGLI family protein [Bizionia argentinensis]|nr:GLPGLI family protein [Bizionia argentinensis]
MTINNIYKLIVLLLLFNFSVYGQTGEITYKITHPEEHDDTDDEMKQVNNETTLMSFSLIFNEKGSFFEKKRNVPQNKYLATMAAIITLSKSSYFQNLESKNIYYNYKIGNKEYIVVDSTKMNSWTLSNETKNIEGFTCYKASKNEFNERNQTNYLREAWYAPDIPVPYGPAGYGGLPGLILEIEIRKGFVYYVSKISLNEQENLELPKLKDGPEISPREKVILMRKNRTETDD